MHTHQNIVLAFTQIMLINNTYSNARVKIHRPCLPN
jgi:hypothetical protein